MATTTHEPSVPLAVRLSAASGHVDADVVAQLLQTLPNVMLSAVAADGGAVMINGAAHAHQQLAVACFVHWTLQRSAADDLPRTTIAVSVRSVASLCAALVAWRTLRFLSRASLSLSLSFSLTLSLSSALFAR